MASVQIKSTTQQTSCVQIGGPASFQDVGPYWRTEANANKGCMWMRTRTKTFAPVTCKPPSSRKNHEKSPQQHNNQSYARCGVLSARSQDVCLMSSHVDVYRGSLQTKNIIIWKITMSILHAIGARWWPTNRGDALQCPNARLKHAADHVAFELPRSSLHGEPHPCSMFSHFAHPKDSSEKIGACHVNTVGT